MFSRATRAPQHLPLCCGTLSHQLHARLATTEAAAAKPPLPKAPVRTAYLKSWRPVTNIAALFSLVREVEKKFGKVMEVHFLKDYEDTTRYQSISYIVFADPQSVQSIPGAGIEMTFSANPVDKPHYEIGIDDLESTMFNNETEGTSDSPAEALNGNFVAGFRMMRSQMDYLPERLVRDVMYQSTPIRTMEHFQNWGGFAKLEPLKPPRTIGEGDLWLDPNGIDQNRMRAALQICARNFRPIAAPRPNTSRVVGGPSQVVSSESTTKSESPVAPGSTPKSETAPIETFSEKAEPVPESTPSSVSKNSPEKAEKSSSKETAKETSTTNFTTKTHTSSVAVSSSSGTPRTQIPSAQGGLSKKQKPSGPKLVIPPVQKSAGPPHKKESKPKIKTVKETKARSTPAPKAKSKSQPENMAKPEPPQPKGPLAKIWSMFSRS